jgi:hypothetical protein
LTDWIQVAGVWRGELIRVVSSFIAYRMDTVQRQVKAASHRIPSGDIHIMLWTVTHIMTTRNSNLSTIK